MGVQNVDIPQSVGRTTEEKECAVAPRYTGRTEYAESKERKVSEVSKY